MGRRHNIEKIKDFLYDIIGFNSPKAILFNLITVLLLLLTIPTSYLKYSPFKSINKRILPLFFDKCPTTGIFRNCCPSCGLTRALSRLLHGDINGAINYNPLVFVLLAVILGLIFVNLKKIINN